MRGLLKTGEGRLRDGTMKKNRTVALFLILALLLSSCGIITFRGGEETTGVTETEPKGPELTAPDFVPGSYETLAEPDGEAIAEQKLAALPEANFDGLPILILAVAETGDIFNEETGLYSQAVRTRNEMVAQKYNTGVVTTVASAKEVQADVRSSALSGDYLADFVVLRARDLGSWFGSGYIKNLRSLAFFDPDAPCFDKTAMEQLGFGGVIYGAVGHATEQIEHYACLYYNGTLAEKRGLSLDYGAIMRGELTWERFLSLIKEGAGEENASYVSAFDREEAELLLFFSTGQTFLSKNGEGKMRLGISDDVTAALVSSLKELRPLTTEKLTLPLSGSETGEAGETRKTGETLEGMDIFLRGKALAALGQVGDMNRLANAGFRWEALPLPKSSEDLPGYSTGVTGDAPVMAVLSESDNIDHLGYFLTALNTASEEYLKAEFYRDAMKRLITGVHTLDMLDLICQNPVYDFSRMFGSVSSALRNGTVNALREAVEGKKETSYYFTRYEKALNSYLDGL